MSGRLAAGRLNRLAGRVVLFGLVILMSTAARRMLPRPAPAEASLPIQVPVLVAATPAPPSTEPTALPQAAATAVTATTATALREPGARPEAVDRPRPVRHAPGEALIELEPSPPAPIPPRLIIPSLEVDEAILTIPVVDGSWDLSALETEFGWLSTTGSQPGDDMAMAFAGHLTLEGARRGPLADIWDLQTGDEIVYRANGTDYVYAVVSRQTVRPSDVDQLYVEDGQRLLLVTCTNWDFLNWEYSHRLVVQAQLAHEAPAP